MNEIEKILELAGKLKKTGITEEDFNLLLEVPTKLIDRQDGEIKRLLEALEKIADPRKRDHTEPDYYTELCCVMTIANEALNWFNERQGTNF